MSPTWQRTPCPDWCAGGHEEQDLPEDRVHRSVGFSVPTISRRVVDGDALRHATGIHEYEIGLSRDDGGSETWLYLGAGPEEYLEIGVAGARALVEALDAALDAADTEPSSAG